MMLKTILLWTMVFSNALLLFKCEQAEGINGKTRIAEVDNSKLGEVFASEKYNPQKNYESLSLLSKRKPFIRLGEKTELLDKEFSFNQDFNGKYLEKSDLIVDYFSTDADLSVSTEVGSINGILFFSATRKKGEIFRISGNWTIDVDLGDEKSRLEIRKAIVEKLFPILKDKLDFKADWNYSNEKNTFIEYFKISPSGESQRYWNLTYEVESKLNLTD